MADNKHVPSGAKIVKVEIGPYPKDFFDMVKPKVKAWFDDGSEKDLFEFYPDELNFTESEFIGLTETQANQLHFKKDQQYLGG